MERIDGRRAQVIQRLLIIFMLIILTACVKDNTPLLKKYEANWQSLKQYPVPEWLRDGKFGIYTHWGVYSVPAFGPNGTWYSYNIYANPDSKQRKYHEENFGSIKTFGYKEFIPMFTAEKFNADEWADLFARAGARFAGPVAEHHDGFAMWDTGYSEWNAAKMGPKRDVVAELEKAIKKKDMKFVTAFHHAANWFFFPVWDESFDCGDAKYAGLYGVPHKKDEKPNQEFLDEWYGKITEVIDRYEPDFIWYDFALGIIREDLRKQMMAYYYNHAQERGKEVVITYKGHDLPPGTAMRDLELGQASRLTYYEWITDTSVDDQGAWSYVKDARFKPVDRLVDNLVDRVSKNGYLLLNVGPRPDGTIPEGARKCLEGIGDWLRVNGEAIYGTRAWMSSGEGGTALKESQATGFNESDIKFSAQDIRFTVKDNILYAICLDWPADAITIKTFARRGGNDDVILYPEEIKSITMLGDGHELKWEMAENGLIIKSPATKPCDHAFVFKITRKIPD